ncbi:MAG: hypothetical protein IH986_09120 [Planctomycetes bacterium]|nr:hypothetical protein [Planctomycetota bacterium]
MRWYLVAATLPIAVACVAPGLAGEKATVRVHYLLRPTRGIPEGLSAVAILDAGVNDEKARLETDTNWSELAANYVQYLLQEAIEQRGIELDIIDRRHTATVLKEHDLAAAGLIPSRTAGRAAQLLEVQGVIMAEINVRVEEHRDTKKTVDLRGLLDDLRPRKRKSHGGHKKRPTQSAEVVKRHTTVQTVFHLFDAKTSKNWATYAKWHHYSDQAKISDFFAGIFSGSKVDPRDEVIEQAVQRGAREFVGMLVPSEVEYLVKVKSSSQDDCEEGVRALRAEMYEEAIGRFKLALSDRPDDDRAAFAAGVACEALGRYEDALKYYRMASRLDDEDEYLEARRRVKENSARTVE